MFVENLGEKYRAKRRNTRYVGAEAVACDAIVERFERSGILNWSRHTREGTTREKIVTQRDRSRGWSGFSRDVTAPAAGGRRPASPYENTRPVLRPNWLSPGALSCSRRKQTFLGYHAVPSFFLATLSRLAIKSASRRVPVPLAHFQRTTETISDPTFSGDRVRA
jgi:hypothetical protein